VAQRQQQAVVHAKAKLKQVYQRATNALSLQTIIQSVQTYLKQNMGPGHYAVKLHVAV